MAMTNFDPTDSVKWTMAEETKLCQIVYYCQLTGKYSYRIAAKRLGRSAGAIQNKMGRMLGKNEMNLTPEGKEEVEEQLAEELACTFVHRVVEEALRQALAPAAAAAAQVPVAANTQPSYGLHRRPAQLMMDDEL